MNFHEVRFPTDMSLGSTGGPERRTDVVEFGSGHEERNIRWVDSRRSYQAGYGIKTVDQLYTVLEFFEERRGRGYGFRWLDGADYRSRGPRDPVAPTDQVIGTGDGEQTAFQLAKLYGAAHAPWTRTIIKPVSGTVLVALDDVQQGASWTVDETTGVVTFDIAPGSGVAVTAGCDKTLDTCRARFDNIANFRGFPHMPGNDRAFAYVVGESGENDGGSFFN